MSATPARAVETTWRGCFSLAAESVAKSGRREVLMLRASLWAGMLAHASAWRNYCADPMATNYDSTITSENHGNMRTRPPPPPPRTPARSSRIPAPRPTRAQPGARARPARDTARPHLDGSSRALAARCLASATPPLLHGPTDPNRRQPARAALRPGGRGVRLGESSSGGGGTHGPRAPATSRAPSTTPHPPLVSPSACR